MNKINTRGLSLIEFKQELSKDYPKIVKDSLRLSLEEMVKNEVINKTDYERIVDEDIKSNDFELYIESRPSFLKTDEEIFEDFEVIREKLTKALIDSNIVEFTSESVIQEDIIKVSKSFVAEEKFLMEFFGVDGSEYFELTTRKGFIEKYLSLRYLKILKDVCKSVEYDKTMFTLNNSLLFYDKKDYKHKIALQFDIDINDLVENQENLRNLVKHIKEVSDNCTNYFNERNLV